MFRRRLLCGKNPGLVISSQLRKYVRGSSSFCAGWNSLQRGKCVVRQYQSQRALLSPAGEDDQSKQSKTNIVSQTGPGSSKSSAASSSLIKPYFELAKNIKELYHETKIVNVPIIDLAFGVAVLFAEKTNHRRKTQVMPKEYKVHANKLKEAHYMSLHAHAIYNGVDDLLASTMVRTTDILAFEKASEVGGTCYYIAVDRSINSVVVSVRGTYSLKDALVSITVQPEEFEEGHAHRGVLLSARHLYIKVISQLRKTISENPGMNVTLVGHSLGGGTAVLLSILLRKEFPSLKCFAFSPPAAVSKELLPMCEEFVTSFICMEDSVPCASMFTVGNFVDELCEYNWMNKLSGELKQGSQRYFSELSSETQNAITSWINQNIFQLTDKSGSSQDLKSTTMEYLSRSKRFLDKQIDGLLKANLKIVSFGNDKSENDKMKHIAEANLDKTKKHIASTFEELEEYIEKEATQLDNSLEQALVVNLESKAAPEKDKKEGAESTESLSSTTEKRTPGQSQPPSMETKQGPSTPAPYSKDFENSTKTNNRENGGDQFKEAVDNNCVCLHPPGILYHIHNRNDYNLKRNDNQAAGQLTITTSSSTASPSTTNEVDTEGGDEVKKSSMHKFATYDFMLTKASIEDFDSLHVTENVIEHHQNALYSEAIKDLYFKSIQEEQGKKDE
eukprot:Nk52_evm70s1737 gene=Nk52_evmTU70s1737